MSNTGGIDRDENPSGFDGLLRTEEAPDELAEAVVPFLKETTPS